MNPIPYPESKVTTSAVPRTALDETAGGPDGPGNPDGPAVPVVWVVPVSSGDAAARARARSAEPATGAVPGPSDRLVTVRTAGLRGLLPGRV